MKPLIVTTDSILTDKCLFNEVQIINVGQSIHSLPFNFVFVTKKAIDNDMYEDWYESTLKPRLAKDHILLIEE